MYYFVSDASLFSNLLQFTVLVFHSCCLLLIQTKKTPSVCNCCRKFHQCIDILVPRTLLCCLLLVTERILLAASISPVVPVVPEFDNLWKCLSVCCETQLPELLQKASNFPLPVLEEIAGLCILPTSESDMIPLTSGRGLWASFFDYCASGMKAAAPVVVPNAAADSAAAPVSTLLQSRSRI